MSKLRIADRAGIARARDFAGNRSRHVDGLYRAGASTEPLPAPMPVRPGTGVSP